MGQIPESLGSLGLLTTLSLSTNDLSGLIPDVLGNLQALTGLYIDTNKLEGFFSAFDAQSLFSSSFEHTVQ